MVDRTSTEEEKDAEEVNTISQSNHAPVSLDNGSIEIMLVVYHDANSKSFSRRGSESSNTWMWLIPGVSCGET